MGEATGDTMTVSPPGAPVTADRVAETAPVPAPRGVPVLSAPIRDAGGVSDVGSTGALVSGKLAVRLSGLAIAPLDEDGSLPLDGVARPPPPPEPLLAPPFGPAPGVPPLPVVPV